MTLKFKQIFDRWQPFQNFLYQIKNNFRSPLVGLYVQDRIIIRNRFKIVRRSTLKMGELCIQWTGIWNDTLLQLCTKDKTHPGIFTQNSFQIDSINSCHTSKKFEFWLKIVKIIYFLMLKPIVLNFGNNEKNARWRHKSEISKRNVKTMISPLLFRL